MDMISAINNVIKAYFDSHPFVNRIPVKKLIPEFIKAGIFQKNYKDGLPIRNEVRHLDKTNSLQLIPYVFAERKVKNTNWYFVRNTGAEIQSIPLTISKRTPSTQTYRLDSDEGYIIGLCDKVLNEESSRQHKFDFLKGDPGKNGRSVRLPVDAYYNKSNLVIEFLEKQHTTSIKHFDKPDKITVSGVHRGIQRKIYDERRKDLVPKNGIDLLCISYNEFACNNNGKLLRDSINDITVLKKLLRKYIP